MKSISTLDIASYLLNHYGIEKLLKIEKERKALLSIEFYKKSKRKTYDLKKIRK